MIKKNITINFCGRLYNIDEDAYIFLQHYTETIRRYYLRQEGGEEVADDIEQRIAELFDEKKAKGIHAIDIDITKEIVRRIGGLDELAPGEDGDNGNASGDGGNASSDSCNASASETGLNHNLNASEASQQSGNKEDRATQSKTTRSAASIIKSLENPFKSRKQYFRDTRNKVVAGVLSGCSQYFGGSPLAWRIGFVLALYLAWMLQGFHIPSYCDTAIFITYLFMAIIAPAAKKPEDFLAMQGKEVNPQNIAEEISRPQQSSNSILGSIIGFCFTLLVIGFGITAFFSLITALCFVAVFLTEPITWFARWFHFNMGIVPDILSAITIPLYFAIGSGIVLLCIIVFCCIHAIMSIFHKANPMSMKQRIVWVLAFIVCVVTLCAGCFKCITTATPLLEQWNVSRHAQWVADHTNAYDILINDTDEKYLSDNGFTLLKAMNCSNERFTSSGEHYSGDSKRRYLDAYSPNRDLIYHAEACDVLQRGRYRLTCAARCSKDAEGVFLFASIDDGNTTKNLSKAVPDFGNTGLQIIQEKGYCFSSLKTAELKKIIAANDGKGYGWALVEIMPIEIENDGTTIRYGISTDPEFTGMHCNAEWFSACDFKIEKIDY